MASAALLRVLGVGWAWCHTDIPRTPRGCQEPGRGNSWSSWKGHPTLSSSISSTANACLPEPAPSMFQYHIPRNKERFCQTFPAAQEWNMDLGQG